MSHLLFFDLFPHWIYNAFAYEYNLLQAWVVSGSTEAIADRFHELVPDLALDFPFELDNFQKEVSVNATFVLSFFLAYIC